MYLFRPYQRAVNRPCKTFVMSVMIIFVLLNMNRFRIALFSLAVSMVLQAAGFAQTIPLPTSKQIVQPVPGSPQRLNSLPMAMAWSPDHRYLAIVNAGFSTVESNYQQSIAVLDTETGKLADLPDSRTDIGAAQTLYNGVAFSADGSHVYASIDSLAQPEGGDAKQTGNAIAVYRFTGAVLTPERLIQIPLQKLATGRSQNQIGKPIPDGMAIPAPTGLAGHQGQVGSGADSCGR